MWRPDDIVRHPACSHLIGTSQTVQPARNFDIRRNYRTNKSIKSKHGSGPAAGWEEWEGHQAAACRPDSIIGPE